MNDDRRLVDALAEVPGLGRLSLARRVDHGRSGDAVLELRGATRMFAKVGQADHRVSVTELRRETAALRWLDGRIGAPRVLWSGDVAGRPALVTEALDGVALHDLPRARLAEGAAAAVAALRALHALPIADCPFDERLDVKLADARRRADAGQVRASDFDPERYGRAPSDVLADLLAARPCDEDLVVTHGDACWPNFILKPDGTAGIIDLGRFGVADRCQDLALFLRSGAYNAPDLDLRPILLAGYPIGALDEPRLAFFRMLDEFY